jgi:hypothetical protein
MYINLPETMADIFVIQDLFHDCQQPVSIFLFLPGFAPSLACFALSFSEGA